VVRTSGVFGPGGLANGRGNFVELMLRLAASPNPIRVVENHVASPTFAPPPYLRSGRDQPRPPRHQRARIPHPGPPSQVLRPLQWQNGAHRPRPHAVTPESPGQLLRRARAGING